MLTALSALAAPVSLTDEGQGSLRFHSLICVGASKYSSRLILMACYIYLVGVLMAGYVHPVGKYVSLIRGALRTDFSRGLCRACITMFSLS